jgi:hypothetical protein
MFNDDIRCIPPALQVKIAVYNHPFMRTTIIPIIKIWNTLDCNLFHKLIVLQRMELAKLFNLEGILSSNQVFSAALLAMAMHREPQVKGPDDQRLCESVRTGQPGTIAVN